MAEDGNAWYHGPTGGITEGMRATVFEMIWERRMGVV
jgi:hypothetical protein